MVITSFRIMGFNWIGMGRTQAWSGKSLTVLERQELLYVLRGSIGEMNPSFFLLWLESRLLEKPLALFPLSVSLLPKTGQNWQEGM